MSSLAFWKAVVEDGSNFLERVIRLLEERGIRYCVIGGVGVNAYAEPIVTQDLDVVIATEQIETARALLEREFREVMDLQLPVAEPGDLLRVTFEAATDTTRRGSTRAKDILDLARLAMAFPELIDEIPSGLRARVEEAMD